MEKKKKDLDNSACNNFEIRNNCIMDGMPMS